MKNRKLLSFISNQLEDHYLSQKLFSQIDDSIELKKYATGFDLINKFLEDGSFPDLIIIDFSLPAVHQLVMALKDNQDWKSIPVIIVGQAATSEQILSFYQAGANSYVENATDISSLQQQLESICEYWWNVVHLPTHRAS